ncbi:MAG: hypothetical protein ACE5GN_00035 [Waddliaceae bacterium]
MSAKRQFFTIFIAASSMLTLAYASPASSAEECSQEMLMSYYPEQFVAQTLERFQVPQEKRSAILQALAEKDQEVVPIVEEKAGKMNPNPLKDPKRRQEAVMIFRETLYELFAGVMQANGINEREEIEKMLDDIQQQKAKQFAACMEQFQPENQPQSGAPPQSRYPGQQQGPDDQYPDDYNPQY